jgi:hypothetical protein
MQFINTDLRSRYLEFGRQGSVVDTARRIDRMRCMHQNHYARKGLHSGGVAFLMLLSFAQEFKLQEPSKPAEISAEMLDIIIERTISGQDSMRSRIFDMQFHAHSVFREMDEHGKLKKEMVIERIVYEKGDKQAMQYLSMSSNGKALNQKQMANEIADWERQGKKRGTTMMPFDPRYRGEYVYSLDGQIMYEDVNAWIIGFEPKKEEDGYITGSAYIHPTDYGVMRIEASPAKLPGVIKEMSMIYTYKKEQGYWLPEAFEFSMRLKVQFILTFVHNTYTLVDRYSQFVLNSGVPDSLFMERR